MWSCHLSANWVQQAFFPTVNGLVCIPVKTCGAGVGVGVATFKIPGVGVGVGVATFKFTGVGVGVGVGPLEIRLHTPGNVTDYLARLVTLVISGKRKREREREL